MIRVPFSSASHFATHSLSFILLAVNHGNNRGTNFRQFAKEVYKSPPEVFNLVVARTRGLKVVRETRP